MSDQEPNWEPLRRVLSLAQCDQWMWMHRAIHGDRVIESYKHRDTRRYLNLDQDARAWRTDVVAYGCDPWCVAAHDCQPDETCTVEVPLDAAVKWALS